MARSETDAAKQHPKGEVAERQTPHQSTTTALSAGVSKRRLEFLYDGQSRRISKKVMDWNTATSAWVTKDERRFVYDGWKQGDWREPRWISRQRNPKGETSVRRERVNLVAELNPSGHLIKSHTWGMDLSGTSQGAGGVGGLLWSNDVGNTRVLFAAYDGNGNVVARISTSENQAKVKARYDYNAFGETVLQEGDGIAFSNPYRFSTKYQDEETGLYYYGYRSYDPTTGRWTSRDPLAEKGGVHLYRMLGNDLIHGWDKLGLLKQWSPTDITNWYNPPGLWLDGVEGQGRFMPSLGSGRAGVGLLHYKDGVPLFSKHPSAVLNGQVHVIVLEDWKGTSWDTQEAWRRTSAAVRANFQDKGFVWHHEELIEQNGKMGVKLVLVPRELNSFPHSEPASWKRAADRAALAVSKALPKGSGSGIGKCLAVAAKISYILDPVGAIAGPTTEFADASITGLIDSLMDQLNNTQDPHKYLEQLNNLRNVYSNTYYLKHMIPIIDQQILILEEWNNELNNNAIVLP